MKKFFHLLACLVWGGVAITSASAANARAITSQNGSYASCSSSGTPSGGDYCGYIANYQQVIKFTALPCSGGICSGTGSAFTESVYGVGRKDATRLYTCNETNIYSLGPCAC